MGLLKGFNKLLKNIGGGVTDIGDTILGKKTGGKKRAAKDADREAAATLLEQAEAAKVKAELEKNAMPLEAPIETSAEVERAKRRALLRASAAAGRRSTIISDKAY